MMRIRRRRRKRKRRKRMMGERVWWRCELMGSVTGRSVMASNMFLRWPHTRVSRYQGKTYQCP